ncbi:MAG: hypothetical protein QM713_11265 [Arachnia sp.]
MQLVFSGDEHAMNWLRPDFPYAEIRMADARSGASLTSGLATTVETTREGDLVHTTVTIRNEGAKPYFSSEGDIGITLPLEDRYDLTDDQQALRCHAHVFCGGTSSYVFARRMGGAAPYLGLVLTEGSLDSYSIERDLSLSSNDRGCFLLHPSVFVLAPGEATTIAWTIFPCAGPEDFLVQAEAHARFVSAAWDRHVLFAGEAAALVVRPSFAAHAVTADRTPLQRQPDGSFRYELPAPALGAHTVTVTADEQTVRTRILVKAPLEELLLNRVLFIARRQQYTGPLPTLDGAYLIYDNETERVYYNHLGDYNAGRERIGMGVLLAGYLAAVQAGTVASPGDDVVAELTTSLNRFARFVRRELVDTTTGEVFDDAGRDGSVRRLYNSPWAATFFLALHRLTGAEEDLDAALRVILRFYDDGGARFYPIELPVLDLCAALSRAGRAADRDEAATLFLDHARRIAATGSAYPPHEVRYEQSIVAPAVDVLLQAHLLSGDPDLLTAARAQLPALEQFQGMQPDYRLHEVAIRHWDGFWFGKRRLYGDTFPHYWSGLSGNAFALFAAATGDETYAARAEASLRAVLSLIHDDGRATCAHVFPRTVNGEPAASDDPFANDQDWALVFALRHRVRAT